MESLQQNKVLTDLQEKQAKESIKAQKQDVRIAKKGEEAQRSPLQKLISYVELGGIILLIGVFRKPLLKLGSKVFKDIDTEAVKVDNKLKSAIISAEIALRKAIVESYLMDPIQCYRIGPGVYEQLIINGDWHENIYTHFDSLPTTVPTQFNIGTGTGAIGVTNSLLRGLSVQLIGILDYLIISGQDLNN
jgi:hypothetical protein